MIRLHIARHGEPAWHVDGKAVDDPGLTDRGMREVEALADRLSAAQFDAVYVSPLRRALKTAEPVAETLGLKPQVCDWLTELGPPPFEGRPFEEVEEAFLQARARPPAQWWDGMPDGESFREFHRRVSEGLEGLLSTCGATSWEVDGHRMWSTPQNDIALLLVCHAGTAGVVLSHLLQLEIVPWVYERFPLNTGGSAELQTRSLLSGEIWTLTRFEGTTRVY